MGSDVLILTIYFLVVIYVLYQMALSLESQQEDLITIDLDTDRLLTQVEAQLAHQSYPDRIKARISDNPFGLSSKGFNGMKVPAHYRQLDLLVRSQQDPNKRGSLGITVAPLGRRPLGPPIRCLNVQISNRTPDVQVYVDWDRSSITFMSPQSQRVIRLMANMDLDVSQPQVFSVVNPGEALKMDVTTEGCFARNPENQRLEARKPLIELSQLAGLLAPLMEGPPELAKRKSLYAINLMVGVRRIADQESQTSYLLLPFSFDLTLLPGEIAFPPLRWLLNRPRRSAEDFWSTLILGRPSRPTNMKR
jgi:hypothetical protein